MNIEFYLPLVMVILSNLFYQIIMKNTPQNTNPFLSLTFTYGVSATISILLYKLSNHTRFISDVKNINWTSMVLGITIVGVEVGYIFMYRSGWQISKGSLIANICVALFLIVISVIAYKETMQVEKVVGIIFCLIGLIFINK